MRYLGVLVVLGLTIYAVIDCARTEGSQVKAMPKPLWLAVILLIPVIGPAAWVLAGRDRGRPAAGRRPSGGPVAPDDDPTFLRQLDLERRRRAERERLEAEQRDAASAADDAGLPEDDDGTAGVR